MKKALVALFIILAITNVFAKSSMRVLGSSGTITEEIPAVR